MTLDVAFSPLGLVPGDTAGRTVLVVDVLRATTTICAALHHGARAVIVAEDPGDATRIAQVLDTTDVLLAGERQGERIPGFALGNSPAEMSEESVKGKTLVMTTTNGTGALLATTGAREVIIAAGVNFTAAAARARAAFEQGSDVLVLCAGFNHGFGLDDAYIAGRLVVGVLGGSRRRRGLNDAALVAVDLVRRYGDHMERVLALSAAGRALSAIGRREDLHLAALQDSHPVVPLYHDRRVTLPDAGARR
jgi:2-phosphosulfolactate phosphatase